jgi:redox-sensitive bicupin YhaK (pirin superfamily)
MKKIVHPSESRGITNFDWLNARPSFSFGTWFNPERIHFGALRVLNDDTIAPGKGFGTHPHKNMEIFTIPLSGDLKHVDSMGHSAVLKSGEIQLMSAGTGVEHSEFNASETEKLSLFQIWIIPQTLNVQPRYTDFKLDVGRMQNSIYTLIAPQDENPIHYLNQKAWVSMTEMTENTSLTYKLHDRNQGVYILSIEGDSVIEGELLKKRDAIGIWESNEVTFTAKTNTKLLIIEVPMDI